MYTYRLLKAYNIFGYNDSGMVPNHPNHLLNLSANGSAGRSANASIHMPANLINTLNADISLTSSSDNLVDDVELAMSGYVAVGGGAGGGGAASSTNRKNNSNPSLSSPTNPTLGLATGIAMQQQAHQYHHYPSGASANTNNGNGNGNSNINNSSGLPPAGETPSKKGA